MPHDYAKIIRAFAGVHVVVIGDAMLDRYSTGHARRICPEAPVPVIDACSTVEYLGGACNTALNLQALGAQVSLLSWVGGDADGKLVTQLLHRQGVQLDHVQSVKHRCTLVKHRLLAGPQMMLRFDRGTTTPLDVAAEEPLLCALDELYSQADLIVISDYGYGVVTDRLIDHLHKALTNERRILAVDSKRLHSFAGLSPTIVKPNYEQAVELLGLTPAHAINRCHFVVSHASDILRHSGASVAAVTLDHEGAIVLERGQPPYRTLAKPTSRVEAAGAGDTYTAAFALATAAGASPQTAANIAAAAAAVVAGKTHTASCSHSELLAELDGGFRLANSNDLQGLVAKVEQYRGQNRRIVLTNGCFDILHRGHVAYLQRAKALGEVLIVAVNSDSSIRKLKGPTRPINCLEDRLGVLAGLGCVDHLVSFDETTPERVIRALRPDVFTKGGDYLKESLPEAPLVEQLGGRVVILPFLIDHSTSGIVQRIRQAPMPVDRKEKEPYVNSRLGRRAEYPLR